MSKITCDIAVDIESLGTKPGSVILSLAAARFDRRAEHFAAADTFYEVIDLEMSRRQNFEIDTETLKWWMSQSREARVAAFGDPKLLLTLPASVLKAFTGWVRKQETMTGTAAIGWAVGQDFDFPLLDAYYQRYEMEMPIKFRNRRDVRTICDIANEIAGFEREGIAFGGTKHNALDDAIHAGRLVHAALRRLRSETMTA